jgi:uncharacterized membrane protein YcaP (DUF421 family)
MSIRMLNKKLIIYFILLLAFCFPIPGIAMSMDEGPFSEPDWGKIFYPNTPLLEIFIRGTVVYLGIFIMLRVVLKREAGSVGMTDLLVIVLLADAAQNAMADNYESVTDGIFLLIVIISWSHVLNFLGYYFPKFQRLINPPALLLVVRGRMIKKNLRKEFITEDELLSQVREQGLSNIQEVKEAYIESDGRISVIPFDQKAHSTKKTVV